MARKPCKKCDETGSVKCPRCGGEGFMKDPQNPFNMRREPKRCQRCKGSGQVPCPKCNGAGYIEVADDTEEPATE